MKNRGKRVWGQRPIFISIAVILLLVAVGLGFAYWQNRANYLIAGVTSLAGLAGLIMLYIATKAEGGGYVEEYAPKPGENGDRPKNELPNCINIYAAIDQATKIAIPSLVAFEYSENPKGRRKRLRNNNRFYYENITTLPSGDLKPFQLPDMCQYFPPDEYANVYNQPAHTRLHRRRDSLLTKISPGLLVLANIIAFIFLLIVE